MKKILSLAAVASMALAANAQQKSPYQDKNYNDWGKLKLVGNQLSSAATGEPVQLKGWSTFSLHYLGNCGTDKGQFSNMQKYGANIVRLAMYIDDTNDGGSYLAHPDHFTEMIKNAIKDTKDLGMYCLVDWHVLLTTGSGNPNEHVAESKAFFTEISKYCKDNGYDHVLYELCNEPVCSWDQIKKYAEDVIPCITGNQEDAIIIVGTDFYCQKIMEPVTSKINSQYEKNVMYSFHYYSCTHFSLLGDFANAQKSIPVFVSEWSATDASGDGDFCRSNGDEMIARCDKSDIAPQVVSWCIWNWGFKNETSAFFRGDCNLSSVSQATDNQGNKFTDYVINLMAGEPREVVMPETGPWTSINKIPTSKSAMWHWDWYDLGGESVAYHDGNGGAWQKVKQGEDEGKVLDYKKDEEEVDVKSLAYDMQWLKTKCPWSTVENGKVVSYQKDIEITGDWKDADGNKTYKSLNGGRCYSGTDGSARPDEGVDLSSAGMNGTGLTGKYCNLGWVEKGEWINYTVDVAKPGYYKISGVVSNEQGAGGISISSEHGNHLRKEGSASADEITKFNFKKPKACADSKVSIDNADMKWACWDVQDAVSGKNNTVLCAFPKAGEQSITISFSGDAGGTGPLMFDFVGDLLPDDNITSVSEVASESEFTIYPNPTSGEFTVALADNAEATVEIVNMAGQVVASQEIEGTATINKALAAGIYTVVVKSNGAVNTQKLMVK